MAFETLSENTRKVRRSLLAASLVGYLISKIDVSIAKVTIFGTEFKIGNFQAIPFVLGLIIAYYLVTFIFYSLSEYEELYKVGKKEYLSTLGTPTPMTLKEAEEAFDKLVKEEEEYITKASGKTTINHREVMDRERELAYEKLHEIKKEFNRINAIRRYLKTRKTFFDIFSFRKFRYVVELFIPVIIGIYACTIVFFFTKFNVETPKAVKPTVTIITEQVVIQKQIDNTRTKSTTDKEDTKR